jgi:hypothetical protein
LLGKRVFWVDDHHGKTKGGDTMELLLKRNEKPGTFGTRYDLFAKLELNPEELSRFRKAQPDKTYIVEEEYGKNNFRWRLTLIPAAVAAFVFAVLLCGLLALVISPFFIFFVLPVALFSWIPINKLFFKQVSGNVSVGDIITGRTIHCKSLDELLVKENDIRENIKRYCNNLEALHSFGDVQRIKLDQA